MMKLLYIDSSFFLETAKSTAMLMRLVRYLQKEETDVLLVSVSDAIAVKEVFQEFLMVMNQADIHLLVAPTQVQLGKISGEVGEFGAVINQHALKPVAGAFFEILCHDEETTIKRIYLDFLYEDKNKVRFMSGKDLEAFLQKYLSLPNDSKKYS